MSGEIILYQSPDGDTSVRLRIEDGAVWPSQKEIADLFATTVPNINIHIGNALKEGELSADSVIKESLTTAADGKRYRTKLYRIAPIPGVLRHVAALDPGPGAPGSPLQESGDMSPHSTFPLTRASASPIFTLTIPARPLMEAQIGGLLFVRNRRLG